VDGPAIPWEGLRRRQSVRRSCPGIQWFGRVGRGLGALLEEPVAPEEFTQRMVHGHGHRITLIGIHSHCRPRYVAARSSAVFRDMTTSKTTELRARLKMSGLVCGLFIRRASFPWDICSSFVLTGVAWRR